MKNKKKLLIISTLLVLSVLIGVSYAYWRLNVLQDVENITSSSCFNLDMSQGGSFNLLKTYPISDKSALELTPYTFNVYNRCNDDTAHYSLFIAVNDNSTLDSRFIKVGLGNDIYDLESIPTSQGPAGFSKMYLLKSDYIGSKATLEYDLRIWMKSSVTMDDDAQNKTFSSKIVVVGSANDETFEFNSHNSLANVVVQNAKDNNQYHETKPSFNNKAPLYEGYVDSGFNTTFTNQAINTTQQEYYIVYASSYTFDSKNGTYTLTNPSSGKYKDVYQNLPGKYIISTSTDGTSSLSNGYELPNGSLYIQKVGDATTLTNLAYSNLLKVYPNNNNGVYDKNTSGMFAAEDDYGTSLYFRGAVINNYVVVGDYCYQIIRINGDGTTRMIYTGKYDAGSNTCTSGGNIGSSAFNGADNDNAYVGYMYGTPGSNNYDATHTNTTNSSIKTTIDNWYKANYLNKTEEKMLADSGFCGDRNRYSGNGYAGQTTIYNAYQRLINLKEPTLKCANQENDLYTLKSATKGNKSLDYPIGLITADEVSYAGGLNNTNNSAYYLNGGEYWTMSPASFSGNAYVWYVSSGSLTYNYGVNVSKAVRPVINLKSEVYVESGSGVKTNPYIVSID